jgi:hypothetical protein
LGKIAVLKRFVLKLNTMHLRMYGIAVVRAERHVVWLVGNPIRIRLQSGGNAIYAYDGYDPIGVVVDLPAFIVKLLA